MPKDLREFNAESRSYDCLFTSSEAFEPRYDLSISFRLRAYKDVVVQIPADTDLIPISNAGQHIPSRPSRATIWRWVLKGARGHRLQTVVIGGRRYVTREAIAAWVSAINSDEGAPGASIHQRDRQAKHAMNELHRRLQR